MPFGEITIDTAADGDGMWLTGDDTKAATTVSGYGNPYMYTARRFDDESGLYYYRNRHYSPDIKRFLQPDPIGYADGMNMYAYCGNNPVNFIDPMGLWGKKKDLFFQWWFEAGPGHRHYTEGSEEVEELYNSPGVNRAREKFFNVDSEKTNTATTYDYKFGLRGLWESGLNPTQQFCGGYRVTITPNSNDTKTISVSNDTNMKSFLYHLPGTKSYSRNKTGKQIGGSLKQTYTWTEDYEYKGKKESYLEIILKRARRKNPRNRQIDKLIDEMY